MADRRVALVTGASAGIGEAFARALAARGCDVILTARRQDRLEALAHALRAQGARATVIAADLALPHAAAELVAKIDAQGLAVDWLVNNAGYGVTGTFDAQDWAVHAAFLRVMVEAPSELVWRLLPAMRARGYGRIVNVASLAGHVPGSAGHTLYPAVKSYLIKFSQSLALENADRGVKVSALCPGFTYSEFHDVTGTRARMNRMPRFMWQTAGAVAAEGIDAVEAGRAVHVSGAVNRAIKTLVKATPDRLAFAIIGRAAHRWRDAGRKR